MPKIRVFLESEDAVKDLALLADAKIVIGDRAFDMKAGDRVVLRKNLADRLLEAKLAAEVPKEMAFKFLND